MALTKRTKDMLTVALADKKASADLAANSPATQAATVAAISTADATDLASSEALANATKAKVNEIIAALKACGAMA